MLSYNVWFEHERTFGVRMSAIAAIAHECSASVVAFQELTSENAPLLARALKSARFGPIVREETRSPYFCGLATRAPLGPLTHARSVPYDDSLMLRGLVMGRCEWPGVGSVALGSTHLESFVGLEQADRVNRNRVSQLQQAGAELAAEARRAGCKVAVLMGDLNWKEAENGDALALLNAGGEAWTDAWVASGRPRTEEHTYDGPRNAMLNNRLYEAQRLGYVHFVTRGRDRERRESLRGLDENTHRECV